MTRTQTTNPAAVCNLPAHAAMVANIVSTYRRATPAQIHAGAHWYDEAREYSRTLAAGSPFTEWQAAGVIAALSPQQGWAINKRNASTCIGVYVGTYGSVPQLHTQAQMGKVLAILDDEDGTYQNVARHLKGPKESAFYRNICGDHTLPTVDRWAFLTATGTALVEEHGGISKGAYKPLSAAWQEAAQTLGIPSAILQAICWIVERGTGE